MTNKRAKARRDKANRYLGYFLVVIMGGSLLLPLLSSNIRTDQTIPPTAVEPTALPTPLQDLRNSITFEQRIVQSSGLFSVAQPSGWTAVNNNTTTNEAQLTMRNNEVQSVVEARVIAPSVPVTTPEELDAFFDATWIDQSWREYTIRREATRRLEEDGTLVIDFTLQRGATSFIARQIAYSDGEWVYALRAVALPNASEMIRFLLEEMRARLKADKRFVGMPFEWTAFVDNNAGYIVRYPSSWRVVDSGAGAPTSLEGEEGVLRVETLPLALADEAAAAAWVSRAYNASVVSVRPVDHFGTAGFAVAYSVKTLDGDPQSGYVVLLAKDSETAIVANARLNAAAVDLNDPEQAATFAALKGILASVSVAQ